MSESEAALHLGRTRLRNYLGELLHASMVGVIPSACDAFYCAVVLKDCRQAKVEGAEDAIDFMLDSVHLSSRHMG